MPYLRPCKVGDEWFAGYWLFRCTRLEVFVRASDAFSSRGEVVKWLKERDA